MQSHMTTEVNLRSRSCRIKQLSYRKQQENYRAYTIDCPHGTQKALAFPKHIVYATSPPVSIASYRNCILNPRKLHCMQPKKKSRLNVCQLTLSLGSCGQTLNKAWVWAGGSKPSLPWYPQGQSRICYQECGCHLEEEQTSS